LRHWSVRHASVIKRAYDACARLAPHLRRPLQWVDLKYAERMLLPLERGTKQLLFDCKMCGQCALSATGMSCPMNCPKTLRNGPCGGVRADGNCEVKPEMRCVWVEAYDRAARQGRAGDLRLLHRPADHRRWGQSSWLNYWQGRDEELWTGDASPGLGQGLRQSLGQPPGARP